MQRERSAQARSDEGRRTCALSSLLTCALLSSCLVTHELEFEANGNPARVRRLSPASVSAVPSQGSDACGFENESLYFQADYYDEDVDQLLYVLPFVNGAIGQAYPAEPDPARTPSHQDPLVCVPLAMLREACNAVQVFVSDDLNLLRKPIQQLESDPRVSSVEWHLTGPAKDTPGGSGKPYVGFEACLPPDGAE